MTIDITGTDNLEGLEAAIAHAQATLEATVRDHPDRAERLNNLARYLSDRYDQLGNMQDLEAAINHTQAALETTPMDHPGRVESLSNLGFICRIDMTNWGICTTWKLPSIIRRPH